MKHPLREWRKLGECQKVITSPGGKEYCALSVNSEGVVAVTDLVNKCVHLLTKTSALVRSIGKEDLGDWLHGVTFDLKGNVWVTECINNKVVKLSQDGRLLRTIQHAGSESDFLSFPSGVSVSTEDLVYICDSDNHRVTVHDEDGMFLFAFGSKGSGPECFDRPDDIAFGSDGQVYINDNGNGRVAVWSKDGTFKRDFQPKYAPTCIAATSDNHLLITSHSCDIIMVYTLEGELVHEFGGKGADPGRFNGPRGICVDDNGVVYVADHSHVQVF